MRKAYYKGVELWEALQEFPDAFAQRTGDDEHEGVRQTYKHSNPQSLLAIRPLEVRCVVEERSVDAAPGYETGTALQNTLHAVEALLIANADTLGSLCYCENHERKATVTNSEAAGVQVVEHGAPGGGWVPAVNDRVLFRKKTTGEGFATVITAVGGGTITCNLTVAITNAWEVIRVERVFASVKYVTMSRSAVRGPDDPERDIPEVTYRLTGYGAADYPPASVFAHGAT